jgi:ribosome biogenesis protein MAK21
MLIEPEDNEEEHFVDVPEDGSAVEPATVKAGNSKAAASNAYDGKKREPQYANAESSCLWELVRRSHNNTWVYVLTVYRCLS